MKHLLTIISILLGLAYILVANAAAPVIANNQNSLAQHATQTLNTTTRPHLSLNQRVQTLENQQAYDSQLGSKIDALQQAIDKIRGQLEAVDHEIQKLQENQRILPFLEERAVQLEAQQRVASPSHSVINNKKSPKKNVASKSEQTAYQQAYTQMANRQYNDAMSQFQAFIKQYPKSTLVTDSHYWLGLLYLAKGQSDLASQQFRKVIAHQHNDKTPDAMLRLAMIFLTNGDMAHAKQLFQKIVTQYKTSAAAQSAAQQLKAM